MGRIENDLYVYSHDQHYFSFEEAYGIQDW
jgi:hypothetical protein